MSVGSVTGGLCVIVTDSFQASYSATVARRVSVILDPSRALSTTMHAAARALCTS